MRRQSEGLRTQKSKKTRQRILDKAQQLFLKNGLKETTIDDISQASGTSRVTFYQYFADKEAVIQALSQGLWEIALLDFEHLANKPKCTRAVVARWMVSVFRTWDT